MASVCQEGAGSWGWHHPALPTGKWFQTCDLFLHWRATCASSSDEPPDYVTHPCEQGELLTLQVVVQVPLILGLREMTAGKVTGPAGSSGVLGSQAFRLDFKCALGNSLNLCDICFVPHMFKSVSPESTAELLCVCVCVCVSVHTHIVSHVRLFVTPWTVVMGTIASLHCSWDSPGKNTGVGCHALLQGIFPAQGLNPYLLHWQLGSLPRATWEALLQSLDLHNP